MGVAIHYNDSHLLVTVLLLNSPNLGPYVSVNKFKIILLLIFHARSMSRDSLLT